MKKSLLRTIVALASMSFFVALGSVYAAFGKTEMSDDISFYVGTPTGSTINVSNQMQLATSGQYETFNSVIEITDPTDRKKIQLTSDITLTSDLIMTADAGINLNGYTLNLNSFTLYIRHNFFGSLVIENGTIIDASGLGKIVIQTPNATPEIAGVTNGAQYIVVEDFNAASVAQIIFDGVASVLEHGPAGKYHHTDVILPMNYYNSDIHFTYSSDYPSIFTSEGKVYASLAGSEQAVVVTLSLEIEGTTYSESYSVSIVPLTNQTRWLNIAADLLIEYMEPYYDSGTSNYQVSKSVMLLPKNDYIGITYNYSAWNDGSIDTSILATNGTILNVITIQQDIVLKVVPKFSSSVYLDPARELTIDFVAPMTKYDIATYVVNETFGTYIFFNDLNVSHSLIDLADFPGMGIVSLTYSMSLSGYYEINENMNTLTSIADATGKNIYLNIVFTFDDTTVVLRRIRTIFSQVGEVDPFDGYYTLIREMFRIRTNDNYTYNTFYMPSQIEMDGITYLLNYTIQSAYPAIPSGSTGVVTITNDSGNNRYAFTIDKAKIPMDNTTLAIGVNYRLSTWDPSTPDNTYGTELVFILPGVVRNNSTGITNTALYNAIDTVFNNTTDRSYGLLLKDSLSQRLDLSARSLGISDFKGIELLINLRSLDIYNNSFGSSASNLTYLSALKNLVSLNLSKNSITSFSSQISLNNLVTLDISQNTINFTNFPLLPALENLNISSNRLTSLTTLPMFDNLKVLDVSNNSIQFFYLLEKFRSLTSIYTYNNGTYNTSTGIYGTQYSLDNTYNYNQETLTYMNYLYGTNVYNTISGTTPQLTVFTAANKTQSKVLRGIIYVSTTKTTAATSAEITQIMNLLPTTVTSYGGFNHTLSYSYLSSTMFVAKYGTNASDLRRIMLVNI